MRNWDPMAHWIGIDVGSSFLKAAVIDVDRGALIRTARVPFPDFVGSLPALYSEVEPRTIMAAVGGLLLDLAPDGCAGLVLCGQMHGFVRVDPTGEAITNYISWLDQRVSAAEFEQMAALVTDAERQEIGNEFRSSIALAQLYRIRRHDQLPAGATPVSIADYVAGRLCGTMPVMDPTQAAAFGALRLRSGEWHRELIRKVDLETLHWPEVRSSGSVVGCWRGAPCYAPVGDQQCALAGALLHEGELSINIGTGSQVAMLCTDPAPAPIQTRPYFGGRLLRTITHIPGGRALGALTALFTELSGGSEEAVWDRIAGAVQGVRETDLQAAITFFPGPCGATGFLKNMHEGNLSAGHIFRAVFESMARNYEVCARRLDPQRAAGGIVFSGGVARRFDVLRELTAAALGLPSRLSPHPEDTLYGLMVLARQFRE